MITPVIDLRLQHGPVRDQQTRPTCLAFSLSDLNGYVHGQPGFLSPEYLYRETALRTPGWIPGQGSWFDAALMAMQSPGQPHEMECPYEPNEPTLPLGSVTVNGPLYAGVYQSHPSVSSSLNQALQHNSRSIGLAVNLTHEFFTPDIDAVIPFSRAYLPDHAHAVLVVGIGIDSKTGEQHYLIRNSWGASWGDQGHAWLPQQYVDVHTLQIFGV